MISSRSAWLSGVVSARSRSVTACRIWRAADVGVGDALERLEVEPLDQAAVQVDLELVEARERRAVLAPLRRGEHVGAGAGTAPAGAAGVASRGAALDGGVRVAARPSRRSRSEVAISASRG
jgi:hypothetical protein